MRAVPQRVASTPRGLEGPVPEPVDVPWTAGQVRGLRLELVTMSEQIKIWNTSLKYDHYLGPRIIFGRHIRYLVVSDHGYLGAAGFSCASKNSRPRDKIIGWNLWQRRLLLDRVVVSMNHFCNLKSVHCHNLATKVLSMVLEACRKESPAKYGYCPSIVETFVDPGYFDCGCYRAGN